MNDWEGKWEIYSVHEAPRAKGMKYHVRLLIDIAEMSFFPVRRNDPYQSWYVLVSRISELGSRMVGFSDSRIRIFMRNFATSFY